MNWQKVEKLTDNQKHYFKRLIIEELLDNKECIDIFINYRAKENPTKHNELVYIGDNVYNIKDIKKYLKYELPSYYLPKELLRIIDYQNTTLIDNFINRAIRLNQKNNGSE